MLNGALQQILTLRNTLWLFVPFYKRASDASKAKIDRKSRPYRSTTSDYHIVGFSHCIWS
jgi:hypothetical protein